MPLEAIKLIVVGACVAFMVAVSVVRKSTPRNTAYSAIGFAIFWTTAAWKEPDGYSEYLLRMLIGGIGTSLFVVGEEREWVRRKQTSRDEQSTVLR